LIQPERFRARDARRGTELTSNPARYGGFTGSQQNELCGCGFTNRNQHQRQMMVKDVARIVLCLLGLGYVMNFERGRAHCGIQNFD